MSCLLVTAHRPLFILDAGITERVGCLLVLPVVLDSRVRASHFPVGLLPCRWPYFLALLVCLTDARGLPASSQKPSSSSSSGVFCSIPSADAYPAGLSLIPNCQ